MEYKDIKIKLESDEEILNNAVIQRHFTIERGEQKLSVTQLQIICWNDHSVPEDECGYKSIDLVSTYIDEYRINDSNAPILIHCRYFIIY